jgi:hypothetical protein
LKAKEISLDLSQTKAIPLNNPQGIVAHHQNSIKAKGISLDCQKTNVIPLNNLCKKLNFFSNKNLFPGVSCTLRRDLKLHEKHGFWGVEIPGENV